MDGNLKISSLNPKRREENKDKEEKMEAFLKEIGREIYSEEKNKSSKEEIREKYKKIVEKYNLDFETARALTAYYFGTEDKWVKIAAELSPVVASIKAQIRRKIEEKLSQALYLHKKTEKIISKALKALNENECYLKRGIYKDREKTIEILEKEIETLKDFGAWIVDKGIVI